MSPGVFENNKKKEIDNFIIIIALRLHPELCQTLQSPSSILEQTSHSQYQSMTENRERSFTQYNSHSCPHLVKNNNEWQLVLVHNTTKKEKRYLSFFSLSLSLPASVQHI